MLLHEPFVESARRTPQASALRFGDVEVTYGELLDRVERLAGSLRSQLPERSVVALDVRKSVDAITAMLACSRAALTYVPMDSSSPIERRRFVFRDCGAQALVVDERSAGDWADAADLLGDRLVIGPPAAAALAPRHRTIDALVSDGRAPGDTGGGYDDVAYVLYTSGSTGDPKGVVITQRNASAAVEWALGYFDIGPADRVVVHSPLHFDLPVLDIYGGLGKGALVLPVPEQTTLFPQAMLRFLLQHEATTIDAVPSALVALLNHSTLASQTLPHIRIVMYSGEEFHPGPMAALWRAVPNARIVNMYGPIETCVATVLDVRPEHLRLPRIPIGQAAGDATILLVDEHDEVVGEPGVEGEIVVIGPTVTPGYLNLPDVTAATRYRRADGTEGHRTGDFGRWDADGTLHFLGRRDGLVKTRGFRVEIGEIEATLLRHPDVREAAVVARPDPEYTNLLHAFVVLHPDSGCVEEDLLQWCGRTLTHYMLPRSIRVERDLPRTSSGKISRRALLDQIEAVDA